MDIKEKEYRFKFLLRSVLLNTVGLEVFTEKFVIYSDYLAEQDLASLLKFFEEFLGVKQVWYDFRGFIIKEDFEKCYQHLTEKAGNFDFQNHKISYFKNFE